MARNTKGLFAAWQLVPTGVRARASSLLTSAPVRFTVGALTGSRLRILGYHGVDDARAFERGVVEILRQYQPVSGSEVAHALTTGEPLPPRSVWFTFDDGLKSTLDFADCLSELGVRATVFVNPSVIEHPGLLWFQVLNLAHEGKLIRPSEEQRFSLQRLKRVSDEDRRRDIAELERRLAISGCSGVSLSASPQDIRNWIDMGHEVGNHTWDHPCLDRCSPSAQLSQIKLAHSWLVDMGIEPRFFAYPNGDWTAEAADVARELGYVGALLFDHRLARLAGDPYQISRLRIDSSADVQRVNSIVSGAHSTVFAPLRWVS